MTLVAIVTRWTFILSGNGEKFQVFEQMNDMICLRF